MTIRNEPKQTISASGGLELLHYELEKFAHYLVQGNQILLRSNDRPSFYKQVTCAALYQRTYNSVSLQQSAMEYDKTQNGTHIFEKYRLCYPPKGGD